MASKILFVVEGKREKQIFQKVLELVGEKESYIYIYDTNIHVLYQKIKATENEVDSFANFLAINKIKDNEGNLLISAGTKANDVFSSIYLIFDLEPQDSKLNYQEIDWLLRYFDDETRNGLLFINYPLLEAMFDEFRYDYLPNNYLQTCYLDHVKTSCKKYKKEITSFSIYSNYEHQYSGLDDKTIITIFLNTYRKIKYLGYLDSSCFDRLELNKFEFEQLMQDKVYIINTSILLMLRYRLGYDLVKEE
ncbi:MAG: hypothetical protein HUJ61_02600 [Bacilli bacterium]|nr:hypothetical protein [Bacilli bacterium]